MDILYMASHYPLSSRDHIHTYPEHHPEHEVFRVDMDSNDYSQSKPLPNHHLHIPAATATQYTSSPSLDSQTDDEEKLFDVDVDFSHIQSNQPQLVYDHMSNPPWDNIATPRAWDGEPHKVPALEPDSNSPFGYPQDTIPHHNPAENSSSMLYSLSDYLQTASPAHSPPTSYVSTPGSTGLTATMLPPASYYSVPNADTQPQQSPYALASRYNAALQTHDLGCDPRFVSPASASPHAGPSSLPSHQDVGISFADVYTDPSQIVKVEQDQQSIPMASSSLLHQQQQQSLSLYDSDSGEDEKSESESDPSYMPSSSRSRPMSLPSASRMRPRHMRSSSAGSSTTIGLGGDSLHSQRPARTPAPEPVPNLTKKSRGRRVPTAAALYGGYGTPSASTSGLGIGGKNARTYVCKVKECGKCFARSEHLKRHVRSIHTNEKPHRCPHSGCNKEFSRHDNLCQHMRVHRNFSAPKDGAFGSF